MGKTTGSNNDANEKKDIKIAVLEHEPFMPITDSMFITSTEFCEKVSALFKSIYSDCQGCAFEINQQGLAFISVFFNHNEAQDEIRKAAVSRNLGTDSNLQNETVRRIRSNDSRNRYGDRYYLTEDGKTGIDDFLFDHLINRNTGKIDWSKIVADVSQPSQYFNQRPIAYTKVSMLDPRKLATLIYGDTDENGDKLEYAVQVKKNIPQGYGGNFQPIWVLEICRVFEKSLINVCNALGIAPSNGLNIIQ